MFFFKNNFDISSNILKEIYQYYSGDVLGVAIDETIRDTIFDGDEAQRKAIIKSYLENIRIPSLQDQKDKVDAASTRLGNTITTMQDWVDAN